MLKENDKEKSLRNLGKDIQQHKQKHWLLLYGNIILIDDKVYYLYFSKVIFSEKDFFLVYLLALFLSNVVFHFIDTFLVNYIQNSFPSLCSSQFLLTSPSYQIHSLWLEKNWLWKANRKHDKMEYNKINEQPPYQSWTRQHLVEFFSLFHTLILETK